MVKTKTWSFLFFHFQLCLILCSQVHNGSDGLRGGGAERLWGRRPGTATGQAAGPLWENRPFASGQRFGQTGESQHPPGAQGGGVWHPDRPFILTRGPTDRCVSPCLILHQFGQSSSFLWRLMRAHSDVHDISSTLEEKKTHAEKGNPVVSVHTNDCSTWKYYYCQFY